jgi:hypothetical protein
MLASVGRFAMDPNHLTCRLIHINLRPGYPGVCSRRDLQKVSIAIVAGSGDLCRELSYLNKLIVSMADVALACASTVAGNTQQSTVVTQDLGLLV